MKASNWFTATARPLFCTTVRPARSRLSKQATRLTGQSYRVAVRSAEDAIGAVVAQETARSARRTCRAKVDGDGRTGGWCGETLRVAANIGVRCSLWAWRRPSRSCESRK